MKRTVAVLAIGLTVGVAASCGIKHLVSYTGQDVPVQSQLNYTYEVVSSNTQHCRNTLYLDHFLLSHYKNSGVLFENGRHEMTLDTGFKGKKEQEVAIRLKIGDSLTETVIRFIRRVTPGHLSKRKKPKVLVIGDSVTSGYGSGSNKSESWKPNQYWAYAKLFFEVEKIDNGDKPDEYNAVFLGSRSNGGFTLHHNDVKRPVKAMAEGYGGASLEQLFEPVFGNAGEKNRFYDSATGTFSMRSYLSKYRTMDDKGVRLISSSSNPSGERVIGSDGKEYVIGKEISSQTQLQAVDVCTPSIIVLNLCHNTSLENYKKNIGKVVETVHRELPETKIVLMTIDEAGTLFPEDYPEYKGDKPLYGGLHDKNTAIYNYVKENVEHEKEGVYLFGAQFVMPTMEGLPTIENNGVYVSNPSVLGPGYHPNNKVHEAWGYALYAMIKWMIS